MNNPLNFTESGAHFRISDAEYHVLDSLALKGLKLQHDGQTARYQIVRLTAAEEQTLQ